MSHETTAAHCPSDMFATLYVCISTVISSLSDPGALLAGFLDASAESEVILANAPRQVFRPGMFSPCVRGVSACVHVCVHVVSHSLPKCV